MYHYLILREGEEEAIIDIAVKSTMMYGKRFPSDLAKILPLWKNTSLYERGVFLRKRVFQEHAPSWKVKRAIQHLDQEDVFIGEYDRDFFQGIFDASSRLYVNGTYRRAEFGGRKHLKEFLESDVHGQNITFANMKGKRKRLSRSKALPFLEVPQKNNLDRWFVGAMCGSDLVMINGEPMMKMKNVCRPRLDRLGVLYEELPFNNIMISCFYFLLYMADVPDYFVSYWMSKIPHKGVTTMPKASMAAAITWRIMNDSAFTRGMLPCLLDSKTAWRSGIKVVDIEKVVKGMKTGCVDERIRTRCERWASLNKVIKEQKESSR
jgi:hypothetical protein